MLVSLLAIGNFLDEPEEAQYVYLFNPLHIIIVGINLSPHDIGIFSTDEEVG